MPSAADVYLSGRTVSKTHPDDFYRILPENTTFGKVGVLGNSFELALAIRSERRARKVVVLRQVRTILQDGFVRHAASEPAQHTHGKRIQRLVTLLRVGVTNRGDPARQPGLHFDLFRVVEQGRPLRQREPEATWQLVAFDFSLGFF